ncbi:MAG: SRPBCC family protein [Betaproteobacteria bacterium]
MALSLLERPAHGAIEAWRRAGAPSLRVSRHFAAAPARVFDAWLDPPLARQWLFATATRPMACAEIDARVGGAFCLTEWQDGDLVAHAGRYLEIAPPQRLAFTLASHMHAHAATRVAVVIEARRRGCTLTLAHYDVPRARVAYTRARWTGILFGLGVHLAC